MNPIDREDLIQHCWDILMLVLFQPQTHLAMLAYLGVGLLVLGITLGKTHGLAATGSSSPVLGLLCGSFGLLGLLAIAALLQMYAVPLISKPDLRQPGLIVGVVLAFFLMIVPFTRMSFRAGYGASCMAWLLALVLGILAIFGMKQGYDPKPATPDDALKGYNSFGSKVEKQIRERVEPVVPVGP